MRQVRYTAAHNRETRCAGLQSAQRSTPEKAEETVRPAYMDPGSENRVDNAFIDEFSV